MAQTKKEINRRWYVKNLEKNRALSREKYKENKDRHIEYCRKWQSRNQERIKSKRKSYLENNKEYIRLRAHQYRENKKLIPLLKINEGWTKSFYQNLWFEEDLRLNKNLEANQRWCNVGQRKYKAWKGKHPWNSNPKYIKKATPVP